MATYTALVEIPAHCARDFHRLPSHRVDHQPFPEQPFPEQSSSGNQFRLRLQEARQSLAHQLPRSMADLSLRHAGSGADFFPASRLTVSPIIGRLNRHEIFLALQLVSQHRLPWEIPNSLILSYLKHLVWQSSA